ncbi:hypothetical protein F5Y12DRAFT_784487 [Xylaria sp. FL1777]|nr:hypothetical protein F5Y12DRAFT_784487 [Xylaria sp. FL1777]
MTSSNAAPTDEGRAAAATTTAARTPRTASPPPAAAAAPSPRPRSHADGDEDASGGALNTDLPIPSPPTVSPLSTPAATHVNVDDNLPDDALAKLTADLPPLSLARDSSIFRSGMFGPTQPSTHRKLSAPEVMQLDEPFMPDQTSYRRHSQVQAIATTDPDPHSADYPHGILSGMRLSQGSIDPSAYIMNLAAQATLFHDQGPSVVAPSAVSLHSLTQESDALTGSAEPASTNGSQKLESFARIEFADSTFQMTTYAVIIGRDKQAMEQARADERREAAYRRKCEENERNGLPPPTPIMYDRGKFSKSYVSEEGGMLGPEHSDGENVKPVKKRRPSSAVQSVAGDDNASGNHVQSNRQYVSHTTGAAAHIPFIGIHSPGPDIASKTRGISRQHLKIQFNKKRGIFEGIALHKNGFFCEDVLYGLDQPATLRSGDRLQIKDVEFFFVINGVQIGIKRMSVGGKEMSLDFEHSDHENFRDTTVESERVSASLLASVAEPGPGQEVTGAQPIADMLGELPPEFATPDIPKRRGPGRPPKDGIMSKRERRLLKKQMQETSKKTIPQDPQEEKIKRPVGRPRKNPLTDDGDRPEKRKYNKKKREDGEEGSDKFRPKSPPLDLRIEDYTAEQLQKPTKNYGVLIDEALTNGPPDGLTLKQIYKRITARYPWFFFRSETKGWESSKDEETGLWSRVPGVELDAGKKRKATSPDRHLGASHLHSHLSHPPSQKPPQPSYTSTGQNTQLNTTASQPLTQPVYAANVPAPAQLPPGYGSLTHTYSSPYARPPPPSNPPAKVKANQSNTQTTTASSTIQSATPTQQQPSGPSVAIVAGVGPREQLSPEIERAIAQFSANMLNVISKQTPHAASIIEAAANRVRGLPVQNRVPGFDSVENTLINAMQGMIKDMRQKHHYTSSASLTPSAPAQPSSTSSPAPPNTAEAEIQRRLKNFRDSMVTALKTKTDKAEIIVDSAINRAQGLPHAGKIPGWEEADKLMVNAHSLQLQNASPTPANTSRTAVSQPPQPASAQTPIASTTPQVPSSNGVSTVPYTSSAHSSVSSTQNSNSASMVRPGMPLQRPAPVALTRPPTGPVAPSASTVTPAVQRPNVSSPAPPSAGVLDQITGHKRFTDDVFHKSHNANGGTIAGIHTANNAVTSSNTIHNSGVGAASSSSVINSTPLGTAPSGTPSGTASNVTNNAANYPTAFKAPAPIHNMSSPAPPSAGVVDQIAGHKRSLDDGPGSANTEQPEPKRLGVSST